MELARTEGVGSTGSPERGQNFVIAQRQFEGLENVALEGLDEATQPRQANKRGQT